MADLSIQQLDEFRQNTYGGRFRKRLGQQVSLNALIPYDEDKTRTPVLDFSKEDSMEVFRVEKRNFPVILAKRILYHLDEWSKEGHVNFTLMNSLKKILIEAKMENNKEDELLQKDAQ